MSPEKPQILKTIDSLILLIRLYFSWKVPFIAKFIPTVAFLFYAILPTDIITDFIPVLGAVDDAAVLASCAYLLVKFTPADILYQFENNQPNQTNSAGKKLQTIDIKSNNQDKEK